MKTEEEVRAELAAVESRYAHVLDRRAALIEVNAPVALLQTSVEAKRAAFAFVLGEEFVPRVGSGRRR